MSQFSQYRRRALLLAAALALGTTFSAQADNWPSKPIKLVVPYPPGGAADTVGRIFAEKLSESLKQSVVVDNRPGAGTAIAAKYVAKSAPDGYTLSLVPTGQLTILPHLAKEARFDPFTSFTPISQLAYTSVVIAASPELPANNLKEAVALAKAKPGRLSYSSSGSAPAVTALLGNEVNLAFDTLTILAPQIKAGKIKGLAIAARERSPLLPNVPTVIEAGYADFEVPSWFGLVAPAGTPKEIVQKLNAEIATIAKQPATREKLAAQGLEPWPSTPEQFAQRIKADYAKYGQIVKKARITFD